MSTSNLYRTWNVFICSFCADADRNEHWQQYAKRAGYALAFDASILRTLATAQGYSLAPVVYGDEKAEKVAAAVLQDNLSKFMTFKSPLSVEATRTLSHFTCQLILGCTPFFKNKSFERENEWRLVKVARHADDEMKIRPSNAFGLLSYHDFKFNIKSSGKKRISGSVPRNLIPRVLNGPGADTDGYLRATLAYEVLKKSGFETLVGTSPSTLRFID